MQETPIHNTNWLRNTFNHGKWALLSSLVSKGSGFLLLPLYTRYFDESGYGILSSITSIGQLLALGITLYMDMAFSRFIHDVREDKVKLRTLISTYYTFVLLWGPIFTALVIYSSVFWARDLLNISIWPSILLAFIPQTIGQLGIGGIHYFFQNLKIKKSSLLVILSNLVNLAVTAVLITGFGMDYKARLIGTAIASLILFTVVTYYFLRNNLLVLKIDFAQWKALLRYAIPLLPLVAQHWIVNYSNRIIISHFDTLASTAVYSFTFQIAQIAYFLQESATRVIAPMAISGLIHDKAESVNKLLKASKTLFLFMVALSFCAALFSRDFIQMMLFIGRGRSSYLEGSILLTILVSSNIFVAQRKIFSSVIDYHKKTWIFCSGGLIMGALNLALNLLLIPRYGLIAAAYITVVSEAGYFAWILFWTMRVERLRLQFSFYLMIAMVFGIPAFIIYRWMPGLLQVNVQNIIAKLIICAVFIGVIFRQLSSRYRVESSHAD